MENTTKMFPCIWQAALLVVGYLVLQFVIAIALAIPATILGMALPGSVSVNAIVAGGSAVLLTLSSLIILALVCRFTNASFKSFFAKPKGMAAALCAGLVIFVIGNSIVLSEINNIASYYIPIPDIFKELLSSMIGEPVSSFLMLCVMAPVAEEVICRGIIVRGFQTHYSVKKTVIASAVIFALMHLNPIQFVPAFVLGALFAVIYIRTESLWLVIAAHFLNNFMAWLVAFKLVPFEVPGFTVVEDTHSFQPVWFTGLGLILWIAGAILVFRSLPKQDTGSANEESPAEPSSLPDCQTTD